MQKRRTKIFEALSLVAAGCLTSAAPAGAEVETLVSTTPAGEKVVTHEIVIDAPVAKVWDSFTTVGGWTSWASPLAEIDLQAGGTIRTHYDREAAIGDPGTNVLRIVNYVPHRVLTLQADVEPNWPELMKDDAEHLMNVIVFEALDEQRTKVLSYGVGYRDTPAYEELLAFFIPANEKLYRELEANLEAAGSR